MRGPCQWCYAIAGPCHCAYGMSGLCQEWGRGYGMSGSGNKRYGMGAVHMEWAYYGMGDPGQEICFGMGGPS